MTDPAGLLASLALSDADLLGDLEDTGPRVGADTGAPMTRTRVLRDAGALQVGIWECTPGGWTVTNRPNTEIVHILHGRAQITDADGGGVRELVAGSVLILPIGWSGRWDISETIRKVYVTVDGL